MTAANRTSFVLRLLLAAVLTACAIGRTTAGETDDPQLTGTLYKVGAGDAHSSAVSGASVYIHAVAASDDDAWIGPSLTDAYGRYVFYNVPPGQYLMRMYSGTIRLWQQIVRVPSTVEPVVIRDIRVVYYPKDADNGIVADVLSRLPLPYDQAIASSPQATNIVWFGDQVSLADVRQVADALLKAGVQLRAIRRFHEGSDWRAKVIEVGASPMHANDPLLTIAVVDAARDFPRAVL